ncbi:hypothetical protein [Actinoplanes sp. NPDC089786]|uniref:hypothetical protein n=1 Tax=Actinoplanes sp. NPDC089786 TaxID=3155185 RepID=UPI0034132501
MTRFLPPLRLEHLVPACAVAVVLVVVTGPGSPGAGTGARWAALALLAAPAVMIYIHRPAAALASVVCAFGWALFGPGYGWRDFLPFAYALVTIIVARRAAAVVVPVALPPLMVPVHEEERLFADAPHEVLVDVHLPGTTFAAPHLVDEPVPEPVEVEESAGHRPPAGHFEQPPWPRDWPVVARVAGVSGGVALAVAGGLFAWWQVSDQPVGSGAWLLAAGVGAALVARARERRRAVRRLFGTVQPVRRARVVDQLGYVHVLVPAADGRTAVEFGIDTADDWSTDDEAGDPQTRPALLYGDPAPGEWCAVVVDGRLHVPVEPVGAVTVVPYDADHGLPREISDDEEQLVDPDALRADDHLLPPGVIREHRVSPARAWCTVAAIGLGTACAAAEGMHVAGYGGDWPSVAVVALASLAAVEFGWRWQIRERLYWNVGGVTAVGFRGTVSEPWTVDTAAVHDDEGAVTLAVGDSVLTVPVPPPWPRTSSQRTRDQLVAALRDARWQAFATDDRPPPPPPLVPRRPLLLVAAWAVAVAAAVALFAD